MEDIGKIKKVSKNSIYSRKACRTVLIHRYYGKNSQGKKKENYKGKKDYQK